jgi:hypothetical protein
MNMITKECYRYGELKSNEHFWIVGSLPNDCYKELAKYAKEHPEQMILYSNCGTKPGYPIPVPETVFEVYTPKDTDGLLIGWSVYQYGRAAA